MRDVWKLVWQIVREKSCNIKVGDVRMVAKTINQNHGFPHEATTHLFTRAIDIYGNRNEFEFDPLKMPLKSKEREKAFKDIRMFEEYRKKMGWKPILP